MSRTTPLKFIAVIFCLIITFATFTLSQQVIDVNVFEILPTGSQCGDPDLSSCELRFILSATNSTTKITLPSTSWGYAIDNVSARHGKCSFDATSSILTLETSPTTNSLICNFLLKENVSVPSYTLSTSRTAQFPVATYFPDLPTLAGLESACHNSNSVSSCHGTVTIPRASLPITIRTTSFLSFAGCSAPLQTPGSTITSPAYDVSLISSEFPDSSIGLYNYMFTVKSSGAPDILICDITIQKSPISPYFHLISNNILIKQYNDIVHTDEEIYFESSNCQKDEQSVCDIMMEIRKEIPDKSFTLSFSHYFSPIPGQSNPVPCPATMLPPRGRDYVLYCQTVQKRFHVASERAVPNYDDVTIKLIGPYFASSHHVNIQSMKFSKPVVATWDLDDCANGNSPSCKLTLTSYYMGPPIQLDFNNFPYETGLGFITCSSPQMNLRSSLNWFIDFPGANTITNDNQWITQDTNVWPRTCTVEFLLKYAYTYPNTDPPLQSKLVAFKQYQLATIRDDFDNSMDLTNLSGDQVQFTNFPIKFTSEDNCSDSFQSDCSINIAVKYNPISATNYLRSFSLYLDGIDAQQTLLFPSHTFSAVNFAHIDITVTVKQTDATQTAALGLPSSKPYFDFTIDTRGQEEFFYIDSTIDAYITFTFPKAPGLTFTGSNAVIPRFLSYAGATVASPLAAIPLFPTGVTGINIEYEPPTMVIFNDDCRDITSLYCTFKSTRLDTHDDFTYFSVLTTDRRTGIVSPVIHQQRFFTETFDDVRVQTFYAKEGYAIAPYRDMIALDWNQFVTDAQPDVKQITQAIVRITKRVDSDVLFTVRLFTLDNSTPKQIVHTTTRVSNTRFSSDALPEFGTDCTEYNVATCTVRYQITNDIPPTWDIILHPTPDASVHHLVTQDTPPPAVQVPLSIQVYGDMVVKVACENAEKDGEGNDIEVTFTLSRIGQTTYHRYNTDGTESDFTLPTDVLRLRNDNAVPLYRVDHSKPMVCEIQYALGNFISKPRHRLVPYVIHNNYLSNYRGTSVFFPQVAWTPIVLESTDSCFTQPRAGEKFQRCYLVASFFGSPRFPLDQLYYITPPTFPTHPLIWTPYVHKFYSEPVLHQDSLKPENQAKLLGQLEIRYLQPTVDMTRIFRFTTVPGYSTRTFVSHVIFENEWPLQNPRPYPAALPYAYWPLYNLYAPKTDIEITLNDGPSHVTAKFTIPYQSYGTLTTLSFNQTKFTEPGYALMKMKLAWNFISTTFDVDFGFRQAVPCIRTTSAFTNPETYVSFDQWHEILKAAPTSAQIQADKAATPYPFVATNMMFSIPILKMFAAGTLKDPIFAPAASPTGTQVGVLGYFVPVVTGTSSTGQPIFQTQFLPNLLMSAAYPSSAFIGQSCMAYIPVSKTLPSVKRDMKQTSIPISSAGVPQMDARFYAYHNLPEMAVVSSQLMVPAPLSATDRTKEGTVAANEHDNNHVVLVASDEE